MESIDELVAVVARLRGPDGCPWDRAQDPASMRRHLVEQALDALWQEPRAAADPQATG